MENASRIFLNETVEPGRDVRASSDEVDRPEHVEVRDDDDARHDDADDPRSSRRAQRERPEWHPDGHEPISADHHDQPGAEVYRDEKEKHQSAARGGRQVQPLDAGHEADPGLERADVQHRRVDDGQQLQIAVDGRGAHASSQHHRRRHRVSGRADENDNRKHIADQREGDVKGTRRRFRLRVVVVISVVTVRRRRTAGVPQRTVA